jgi:hypothetical protein
MRHHIADVETDVEIFQPMRHHIADVETDVEIFQPYAAPYAALYCYMLKNGVIGRKYSTICGTIPPMLKPMLKYSNHMRHYTAIC